MYKLLPHEIRAAQKAQRRNEDKEKRIIELAAQAAAYPSLVAASRAMGCSVAEIVRRRDLAKRLNGPKGEFSGLTVRAANGIHCNRHWLETMPTLAAILRIPNVGRVTATEIALWLEVRHGIERDTEKRARIADIPAPPDAISGLYV